MQNILMVCLGNICRSPLAQGILESKTDPNKVFVDSAATASWHQGKAPDVRSIAIAAKYNIDISKQKSRPFNTDDFDIFDKIYVMDKENYANVLSLTTLEEHTKKVELILDVTAVKNKEVPDPYYGADNGFEKVYQLLDHACQIIAQDLKNQK